MGLPACVQCKQALPSADARFCPGCGAAQARVGLSFGDYEAVEVLGEGGMGRVYRAVQRRLNRTVCVKVLLPQYATDETVVRRFEREATTMAALSHPNIVQVFDVGRADDGTPFIAMELVEGRPLRKILRDEAPVPVLRAIHLIDQILAGLGEAHNRSIVHRDLKPGNVLVTQLRDGHEVCKVLDFGIAHILDESASEERLTRTGMMVGTPGYMAPEQMLGEPLDARADLYSAGVLLYELLTGTRVFKAPTESELMKKVLLETPVAPSTRTRQPIPSALDAVCLKALARAPRDRYRSADELREALRQAGRAAEHPGVELATDQVVYTSLATAVSEQRSDPTTDTRSLMAALLNAADEWERGRLLEPYERSLRQALYDGELEVARRAVAVLQQEQAEKGVTDNLKALLDTTRQVLVDGLPTLIPLLGEGEAAPVARHLVRILGKGILPALVGALADHPAPVQQAVMTLVHAMDPESGAIPPLLRTLPGRALTAVFEAARSWPGDEAFPLYSALLLSPDSALRITGLRWLDERTAFRLGAVVRQRLHDPVPQVRAEALKWVLRLEDELAVNDLDRILSRATIDDRERLQVLRTLAHLKSSRAVGLLVTAFLGAKDVDQSSELGLLLVRTRDPAAVEHVRAVHGRTLNPKLKRALAEALRESSPSGIRAAPDPGSGQPG